MEVVTLFNGMIPDPIAYWYRTQTEFTEVRREYKDLTRINDLCVFVILSGFHDDAIWDVHTLKGPDSLPSLPSTFRYDVYRESRIHRF